MSAHHALYLALIILVLLAILVLVSAALVRRPRQEWQVAVRGQTQDVRESGMPSIRNPGLRPRKVTLDEMWAVNSVPESAYLGAPKLLHREEVIAALAPAPRELVQQYQGVFLGAQVSSHPAPPPPPSLEDDEFYEPAVVTGEVSVFNAALDRPGYEEDEEWVDGAELKFVDVMREKAEIAKTAWSGVSTWVSDATSLRKMKSNGKRTTSLLKRKRKRSRSTRLLLGSTSLSLKLTLRSPRRTRPSSIRNLFRTRRTHLSSRRICLRCQPPSRKTLMTGCAASQRVRKTE